MGFSQRFLQTRMCPNDARWKVVDGFLVRWHPVVRSGTTWKAENIGA